MDDLDRLYHRLLDAVREGAPHLRERRFRLGDIPQHLLPYRLHRRDLGFDSVQQYERALVRLAAGERGYLSTDAGVHEAFRRAAAEPATPLDQLLRTYGDTAVALAPDSRHRPDAGAPWDGPPPVARDGDGAATEPHTAEMAVPGSGLAASPAEDTTAADHHASTAAAAAAEPPSVPMPFPVRPPAQVAGGSCPHCGRPLPADRAVTFCPYCGENLTIRRCPACSTELEAGWRFCITCGREVDDPVAGGDS